MDEGSCPLCDEPILREDETFVNNRGETQHKECIRDAPWWGD